MRFLTDSMLGTLGNWLRLLGYDTAMAAAEPDAVLVRLARAEDRIILTRDRELAAHRGVLALLIRDDDLDRQLAQVAHDLPLPAPQPGSRCPHCNARLQEASKEAVAGQVPPYVLRSHDTFRRCPECGRVYWRGTHWEGIEEKLAVVSG